MKRKATKIYCWNKDGRNDVAVLASSWAEAVSFVPGSSVHSARNYGGAHEVGGGWINEWPYERGKPMYRPISERTIPWRDTPYQLRYDEQRRGYWV